MKRRGGRRRVRRRKRRRVVPGPSETVGRANSLPDGSRRMRLIEAAEGGRVDECDAGFGSVLVDEDPAGGNGFDGGDTGLADEGAGRIRDGEEGGAYGYVGAGVSGEQGVADLDLGLREERDRKNRGSSNRERSHPSTRRALHQTPPGSAVWAGTHDGEHRAIVKLPPIGAKDPLHVFD